MKLPFAFATILAFASPVVAQQGPERHLSSCAALAGDAARWCEVNQRLFRTAFTRANAGEYHAQRNVAFMLRGSTAGVVGDWVESCAWRLVILALNHPEADGSDTANVRFDCGRITARQREEARQRGVALVEQIIDRAARR